MLNNFIKLFSLQQTYQNNFNDSMRHGIEIAIAKIMPKTQRTSVRTIINPPVHLDIKTFAFFSVNTLENTSVRSAHLSIVLLKFVIYNNLQNKNVLSQAIVDDRSIAFRGATSAFAD